MSNDPQEPRNFKMFDITILEGNVDISASGNKITYNGQQYIDGQPTNLMNTSVITNENAKTTTQQNEKQAQNNTKSIFENIKSWVLEDKFKSLSLIFLLICITLLILKLLGVDISPIIDIGTKFMSIESKNG